MTPAEALALWTGRMGLRKAKIGRKCKHWLLGERCPGIGGQKSMEIHCFPPDAAHLSAWGLGAPDFAELRVLCSHPAAARAVPHEAEDWAWRRHVAYWAPPYASWRDPAGAALQVFVSRKHVDALVGADACPGCRATAGWAARTCCGVGDLAAWWESRAVAVTLMGGEFRGPGT